MTFPSVLLLISCPTRPIMAQLLFWLQVTPVPCILVIEAQANLDSPAASASPVPPTQHSKLPLVISHNIPGKEGQIPGPAISPLTHFPTFVSELQNPRLTPPPLTHWLVPFKISTSCSVSSLSSAQRQPWKVQSATCSPFEDLLLWQHRASLQHVSYSFIMCLVPFPKSHSNFPWRVAFITAAAECRGENGGMRAPCFCATLKASPVSG